MQGNDAQRSAVLAAATSVVIKVGTNVLTGSDGRLDRARIESLATQLHHIRANGRRVVLVSSGAVGAGVGKLSLRKRPTDLRSLQACAAIGQTALMQLYQEALAPFGILPGQILLTAGDFDSRSRYLNVRNTILTLFEYGSLPIINENDTVSVAEIKFGDNDHLAAMVTNLLQAPLLILLTNVEGLYAADPTVEPHASLVTRVPRIDQSISGMAGKSHSALGTGGMRSKLRAARLATVAGSAVIMANGSRDGILEDIFSGKPVGTLFEPHGASIPAWKRWLGYTARPLGRLVIDNGARRAVVEQGRSLLPVGVKDATGTFGKGDIVALDDLEGQEIGRGLTNYAVADVMRIRGMTTEQIATVMDKVPYVELIHRDNLVVTT